MSDVTGTFSRRRFLKWTTAALGATAVSAFGMDHLVNVAPNELTVESMTLKLPRLPRAFDGLTLAQLSDMHHGPYVSIKHIEEAVAFTNEAKPDVVAITGDFIGIRASYMKACVRALAKLAATRLYAVLGNHDYELGYLGQSIALMQASPIKLLRNQAVRLFADGEEIDFVGVDDVSHQRANVARALQGLGDEVFKIALVHEPDYADTVSQYQVDLQLSGHSHGGQVKIPGLGPLILPRYAKKYSEGLYRVGDLLRVYTTRGIGLIQPAIRFNCPPEVTVIRLERA
jgi:predicted MPP superfamily phosphohydrolase